MRITLDVPIFKVSFYPKFLQQQQFISTTVNN